MRIRLSPALLLVCGLLPAAQAADPSPQEEFFEKKIRPLLVTKCYDCHGDGNAKGGLSLDSRDALLKGGDSGESVAAGKPDESLLIEAVQHVGDIKMPPKTKLADQEIADLVAWVAAGAVWPESTVSIPLGNLFDDDDGVSLGDAIASDEFKGTANVNDLGVERVLQGLGTPVEIAPGIRFDFRNLGGDGKSYGLITNDAWSLEGGIQTKGEKYAANGEKKESGFGMHANALVTFDLAELRKAGGFDAGQPFVCRVDRAGLNDDTFGSDGPSAHLVVIATRIGADPQTVVTATWLNGKEATLAEDAGVRRVGGEIPAALKADGKFVDFTIDLPADARFLTFVALGAGTPVDNSINSDHVVFSGARLEFKTTSTKLASLGKERLNTAGYVITPEQRSFWSFQPVVKPELPAVRESAWVQQPVDQFILADLERNGLQPNSPAEKRALLRRATFDLIGLPPSPAEIDAFVNDVDPRAFEKVVDRLLASEQYGERWGRYWLDIARYAEDQAHTFAARNYPQGYRYRDWVVQALNSDMPYDRFIQEQIAGDLLAAPDRTANLPALGYFALGPVYYADAGCAPKAAADELDDRLDTLGRGFLGLTLACARCHDHKFDPISQEDYYAIAGIFSSSQYQEAPLVPGDVVEKYQAAQKLIKDQEQLVKTYLDTAAKTLPEKLTEHIAQYVLAVSKFEKARKAQPKLTLKEFAQTEKLSEQVLERWSKYLGPESKGKIPQLDAWFELRDAQASADAADELLGAENDPVKMFAEKLQAEVRGLVEERQKLQAEKKELDKPKADYLTSFIGEKGLLAFAPDKVEQALPAPMAEELAGLRKELETRKAASPPMYPTTHALTEGKPADMPIYIRGNHTKHGPVAKRRFLGILSDESPKPFEQGSGRLDLAQKIASRDNPLTARVFVNRVWKQHFGRGLVGTPSNFGMLGERPTHPALLDFLAADFMEHGWSIKRLHRTLMLSATYQMSTAFDAANFEKDPDNRLWWRMNRRRLDVEAWRDSLLAAGGNLNLTVGGPSGELADAGYVRRTLYGKVSRHNLDGLLRLFDFPDPNITSEARPITTVPLQQLFVLNSDFMVRQSRALAGRLNSLAPTDPERIRAAFLLLYGRPADEEEVQLGQAFLAAGVPQVEGKPATSQLTAWEQYAQALLSSNEFMYVD